MLARQGLIETKPKTILDELGISVPSSNGNGSSLKDSVGKRKAKRQALQRVKKKAKVSSDEESESSNDDHGSDFEISNDDEDDEDEAESDDFANSDDEDDFNPFGSGSESDEVSNSPFLFVHTTEQQYTGVSLCVHPDNEPASLLVQGGLIIRTLKDVRINLERITNQAEGVSLLVHVVQCTYH